jgi:hypothetical protein
MTINTIPPPEPKPPQPPAARAKHRIPEPSDASKRPERPSPYRAPPFTYRHHPRTAPGQPATINKTQPPEPKPPQPPAARAKHRIPEPSDASKRPERPRPCRVPPSAHHEHPRKAPGQPAQPQPRNHARDCSAPTTSYNPAPAGGGRVSRGCGGNPARFPQHPLAVGDTATTYRNPIESTSRPRQHNTQPFARPLFPPPSSFFPHPSPPQPNPPQPPHSRAKHRNTKAVERF